MFYEDVVWVSKLFEHEDAFPRSLGSKAFKPVNPAYIYQVWFTKGPQWCSERLLHIDTGVIGPGGTGVGPDHNKILPDLSGLVTQFNWYASWRQKRGYPEKGPKYWCIVPRGHALKIPIYCFTNKGSHCDQYGANDVRDEFEVRTCQTLKRNSIARNFGRNSQIRGKELEFYNLLACLPWFSVTCDYEHALCCKFSLRCTCLYNVHCISNSWRSSLPWISFLWGKSRLKGRLVSLFARNWWLGREIRCWYERVAMSRI